MNGSMIRECERVIKCQGSIIRELGTVAARLLPNCPLIAQPTVCCPTSRLFPNRLSVANCPSVAQLPQFAQNEYREVLRQLEEYTRQAAKMQVRIVEPLQHQNVKLLLFSVSWVVTA